MDAFMQEFGDEFETRKGVLGVAGRCERIINSEKEANKGISSSKSLTGTLTHQTILYNVGLILGGFLTQDFTT